MLYDDIEHLGNKRIKLINEQLINKLNIGLAKVEKTVKDKLSSL
jgi:DNA-directed RNA polymerase subunit beta